MKHRFRRRSRGFLAIFALIVPLILSLSTCSLSPSSSFHPDINLEMIRIAGLPDEKIPQFMGNVAREDIVADYYRDPETRASVLAFFGTLTKSQTIAAAILDNAERLAVSPTLAFALAYEESKFAIEAVNNNGDSVDRGLFQLNSRSFPRLSKAQFFDPATNARNGIAHLDFCLDKGGNEVAALAMYNAGHNRVAKDGTPQKTLNYVFRIQKYQENIKSLFVAKVAAKEKTRAARLGFGK